MLYLSSEEALLCTPREYWPEVFPSRVDRKITDQNSAFADQENEDQKND
jgi:hypothetical protein